MGPTTRKSGELTIQNTCGREAARPREISSSLSLLYLSSLVLPFPPLFFFFFSPPRSRLFQTFFFSLFLPFLLSLSLSSTSTVNGQTFFAIESHGCQIVQQKTNSDGKITVSKWADGLDQPISGLQPILRTISVASGPGPYQFLEFNSTQQDGSFLMNSKATDSRPEDNGGLTIVAVTRFMGSTTDPDGMPCGRLILEFGQSNGGEEYLSLGLSTIPPCSELVLTSSNTAADASWSLATTGPGTVLLGQWMVFSVRYQHYRRRAELWVNGEIRASRTLTTAQLLTNGQFSSLRIGGRSNRIAAPTTSAFSLLHLAAFYAYDVSFPDSRLKEVNEYFGSSLLVLGSLSLVLNNVTAVRANQDGNGTARVSSWGELLQQSPQARPMLSEGGPSGTATQPVTSLTLASTTTLGRAVLSFRRTQETFLQASRMWLRKLKASDGFTILLGCLFPVSSSSTEQTNQPASEPFLELSTANRDRVLLFKRNRVARSLSLELSNTPSTSNSVLPIVTPILETAPDSVRPGLWTFIAVRYWLETRQIAAEISQLPVDGAKACLRTMHVIRNTSTAAVVPSLLTNDLLVSVLLGRGGGTQLGQVSSNDSFSSVSSTILYGGSGGEVSAGYADIDVESLTLLDETSSDSGVLQQLAAFRDRHPPSKVAPGQQSLARPGELQPGGNVSTLTGSVMGFFLDGPAAGAVLWGPQGLAFDRFGGLYIGDRLNGRLRKLSADGKTVSTIVSNVSYPWQPMISSNDQLFLSTEHRIVQVDPVKGTVTTIAGAATLGYVNDVNQSAKFFGLRGLVLDEQRGAFYVADSLNNCIRIVSLSNGATSTLAGPQPPPLNQNLSSPSGLVDGAPATARFYWPTGLALDPASRVLYVADSLNHRIRRIDLTTNMTSTMSVPGSQPGKAFDPLETPFPSTLLYYPQGLALDRAAGVLYVANTGGHRVRAVFVSNSSASDIAGTIFGYWDGATGVANRSTQFASPAGLAFRSNDSSLLFLSEEIGGRIRSIDMTTQTVRTVLGSAVRWDGTLQTAIFQRPCEVTVDPFTGTIYLIELYLGRIRKISPNGTVSTVAGKSGTLGSANGLGSAATFREPRGMAFDSRTRTLIVADTGNHLIRRINISAEPVEVSLVAGVTLGAGYQDGRALNLTLGGGQTTTSEAEPLARFRRPFDVAVDGYGNIFVADTTNNRIRLINVTANTVRTLAGDGLAGTMLDGPGTTSKLWNPASIALGPGGELYMAETDNRAVRKLSPVLSPLEKAKQEETAGGLPQLPDNVPREYTVSTLYLAGPTAGSPVGVAVDGAGNVAVTLSSLTVMWINVSAADCPLAAYGQQLAGGAVGLAPLDGFRTSAQFFLQTRGIAVDSNVQKAVYVTEETMHSLRKIV